MCFAEIVAWQPPGAGSRPVPIGSRFIGVSLKPAIPRRVAPPAEPDPARGSNALLNLAAKDAVQLALATPVAKLECHLYFARRVSFLSCADISKARNSDSEKLPTVQNVYQLPRSNS
jgi:hypothetical protein